MNDLECIAQIWQTLVNYIYYLCIIFFTDIIHSGESLSVKKAVKLPTQGLYAMNRYRTCMCVLYFKGQSNHSHLQVVKYSLTFLRCSHCR